MPQRAAPGGTPNLAPRLKLWFLATTEFVVGGQFTNFTSEVVDVSSATLFQAHLALLQAILTDLKETCNLVAGSALLGSDTFLCVQRHHPLLYSMYSCSAC